MLSQQLRIMTEKSDAQQAQIVQLLQQVNQLTEQLTSISTNIAVAPQANDDPMHPAPTQPDSQSQLSS